MISEKTFSQDLEYGYIGFVAEIFLEHCHRILGEMRFSVKPMIYKKIFFEISLFEIINKYSIHPRAEDRRNIEIKYLREGNKFTQY